MLFGCKRPKWPKRNIVTGSTTTKTSLAICYVQSTQPIVFIALHLITWDDMLQNKMYACNYISACLIQEIERERERERKKEREIERERETKRFGQRETEHERTRRGGLHSIRMVLTITPRKITKLIQTNICSMIPSPNYRIQFPRHFGSVDPGIRFSIDRTTRITENYKVRFGNPFV